MLLCFWTANVYNGMDCLKVCLLPAATFLILIAAAIIWTKTKNRPDKRMSWLLILVFMLAAILAIRAIFFDGL